VAVWDVADLLGRSALAGPSGVALAAAEGVSASSAGSEQGRNAAALLCTRPVKRAVDRAGLRRDP
jgi:hypothetical protein